MFNGTVRNVPGGPGGKQGVAMQNVPSSKAGETDGPVPAVEMRNITMMFGSF
jgi:hypothetical protein